MFGKKKSLLDQASEMVAGAAAVEAPGEAMVKGGGKKKALLAISLIALVAIVARKMATNNAQAHAWQSNYKPSGN